MEAGLPTAGPSNPVKAFGGYLDAVNAAIRSLVAQFEEKRLAQGRQDALTQPEVDAAVEGILEKLPAYENAQDVVRSSLEKSLEAMVLNLVSIFVAVDLQVLNFDASIVAFAHQWAVGRRQPALPSLSRCLRCDGQHHAASISECESSYANDRVPLRSNVGSQGRPAVHVSRDAQRTLD